MDIVNKEMENLMSNILTEIESKNIDIFELSEKLYYSPDDFVDLFKHPKNNLALYIEILEEVRNERV
jgi:hypothetical protein